MRLLTLAILALAAAPLRGGEEEDWPQLLGPARNGVASGPPLAESFGEAGPRVVWKRAAGAGFSGPVVAGGRLVLFHRLKDRETVDCLEAATGNPLWSFDYPTSYVDGFGFDPGPRATPAISGGRVYTFGAQGMLHSLELSSGKK